MLRFKDKNEIKIQMYLILFNTCFIIYLIIIIIDYYLELWDIKY